LAPLQKQATSLYEHVRTIEHAALSAGFVGLHTAAGVWQTHLDSLPNPLHAQKSLPG